MVETVLISRSHLFSHFTLGVWVLGNVNVDDDSCGLMKLFVTVFPCGHGALSLMGCCWVIASARIHGMFTFGGSFYFVQAVLWGAVSLHFPASLKCWEIQNPCMDTGCSTLFLETCHSGTLSSGHSFSQSLLCSPGKPFFWGGGRVRWKIFFFLVHLRYFVKTSVFFLSLKGLVLTPASEINARKFHRPYLLSASIYPFPKTMNK